MKVIVFPGQGTQHKGMGENLFDIFVEYTQIANEILGYSIKELCLEDNNSLLNKTKYAQVAIFVVNFFKYLELAEKKGEPDFLLGHSLGEINALLAAGVFDFRTGLKIVKKRGEIMSKAAGGGMAGVLGFDKQKVKEILINNRLEGVDIANLNSPKQIVISGTKKDIEVAQRIFEENNVDVYVPLNVEGAFHSRYMKESSKEFGAFLETIEFEDLLIPVISNFTARPYANEQIRENLEYQICNSVNWIDSIRYLMGKGEIDLEEIGERKILTTMINEIISETLPIKEESVDNQIMVSQSLMKSQINKDNSNFESLEKSNLRLDRTENKPQRCEIIKPEDLGSDNYKKSYKVKYAYAAGGMSKGISSSKMVVALAKSRMMSYFGSAGLSYKKIKQELSKIKEQLGADYSFGVNVVYNIYNPENDLRVINLCLDQGICFIEASAYMQITKSLVKFRLSGLKRIDEDSFISGTRIQVKISRPEIAETFLKPAPPEIVKELLESGEISQLQADMAENIPVATDICVEADSGGHTDIGNLSVLLPTIVRLKNRMTQEYGYCEVINVGAAGGIGTPESSGMAFFLGADFILTGSINQCTIEAGTSDSVKNILEKINIQDTDYTIAGDMFELGAKVQVVRKGIFFPARSRRLYDIYSRNESIESIDVETKYLLENNFFKKKFDEIFEECKTFYSKDDILKAENNSKYKMSMIFKWYYYQSSEFAISGVEEEKVNYQIHCGPALGAFNQWVKGTDFEKWKNRHVSDIISYLFEETAKYVNSIIEKYSLSDLEKRVPIG